MKRFLPVTLFLLLVPLAAYGLANILGQSPDTYRSPLKDYPPEPGKPSGSPLAQRVVFVLVDGLRLDTSQDEQAMPFLNELRRQGASAAMHSRAPSFSTPAYGVLMTGAWQDLSDAPASNLADDQLWTWTQDNLFSAAHRSGLKTAVSGFYWFKTFIPAQAVDESFFVEGEDAAADRAVVAAALPWLRQPGSGLILIHLDQVDYAGHHGDEDPGRKDDLTPGFPAGYTHAARQVDDLLREIVAPLDLQRDAVLVASDHGHLNTGGHGGPEAVVTTQPFVLVGAGVQPGSYPDIQMVDLAPTVAVLLGLNVPATTQGQVNPEMLLLGMSQLEQLQAAQKAQQLALIQALRSATRLEIPLPASPESRAGPSYPPQAIQDMLADALDPGMIWRLIAVLGVVGMLALGWLRRWSRLASCAFAGAVFYGFLFHEIYTVALGRTYSFSTVASAGDLVQVTLGCAALAFLLAWLGAWLGANWLAETHLQPAWLAVELTLATLSLLLLPFLVSFAWNGLYPRYLLPEYWTLFLALIALIQMIAVAPSGLLLAVVFAWWEQRRTGPQPG